jgi:sulfur carrier protein ThiS
LGYALRDKLGWLDGPVTQAIQLRAGAGLSELYEALGIPTEWVAFATVNNAYPPAGYKLQAGDQVRVMSFTAGG